MALNFNSQLMRKIEYWEMGAKLGKLFFFIFLTLGVVCFVKKKLYKVFIYFFCKIRKDIKNKALWKLWMISMLFIVNWGIFALDIQAEEIHYEEQQNIDGECPKIEEIIIKREGEKNDEIQYYNKEVTTRIKVRDANLNVESIGIEAVPIDEKAREMAEFSENKNLEGNIDILGWSYDKNGEQNIIEFLFLMEGRWKFTFRCENLFGKTGIVETTGKEGIESEEFVIDLTSPELEVNFKNIISINEEMSSIKNINKNFRTNLSEIESSQNEIFLGKENAIMIKIKEKNFEKTKIQIKLYQLFFDNKGGEIEREKTIDDIGWRKEGENYLCSIEGLADGHYRVKIEGQDLAENVLVSPKGSETQQCMTEIGYVSPIYTVDNVKPNMIDVFYNYEPVREVGERQYFQDVISIIVKVQEENFNHQYFQLNGELFYADNSTMAEKLEYLKKQVEELNWTAYYNKDGERINEARIEVKQEANYTIQLSSEDGGQNKSETVQLQFTCDFHKPEVNYTGRDNQNGDLIFKITSEGNKAGKIILFRPYYFFRYFSKERITAAINVYDKISGVRKIRYRFVDENIDKQEEKEIENVEGIKSGEVSQKRKLTTMKVEVSPEKDNFKGYLQFCGEDYSGNVSEVIKSQGIVSETSQMHKEKSNISFDMPQAVFTNEQENIRYYNSEIKIAAVFKDLHSGLYKTSLSGSLQNKKDQKEQSYAQNSSIWDGENLVYEKKQILKLKPEEFRQSSREYPIKIIGKIEDNAGNVSETEISERIIIDDVKPEIKVKYDFENKNTIYYNKPRKAIVTVKEKNFNPVAVKWNIKGSNQKFHIGEWKTQADIHICEVLFEEDGEDYSIQLEVSDYAGNKTEWKDGQYFTIDKTVPEISIKLKSQDKRQYNNKKNNNIYFNFKQKVLVCIQEKNFDKEKMEYDIVAEDGKKSIKVKEPTDYIRKEDTYYGEITLDKEAKYHIAVSCTDKAGNTSDKKELKEFVIDMTEPKVTVQGVANNITYSKKIVQPQVICEDKNLDTESVKVKIQRIDGNKLQEDEWGYEKTGEGDKLQIIYNNLEDRKDNDGIYYLLVEGEDLAGNKIKHNSKIQFQINRYGAEFLLDNETRRQIKNVYLKEEPDIILRERCVDKTDSKLIILKDNEERYDIGEKDKIDYRIVERRIQNKKSKRFGWYERIHYIGKSNFKEEGDYHILLQSDSGKSVDNEMRGKKVHFVVDKTAPAVSISGLEEEIYEEKEHEFTISIIDNYAFDKMEMKIEQGFAGKKQSIIIRPEDLQENHTVKKRLKESSRYQKIHYIAWDKAGNKIDSDENNDSRRCLITAHTIVKKYYKNKNQYILKGVMSLLGILIISVGSYEIYKRKRNVSVKF